MINVSAGKGPYGIRQAVIAEPYEFVGEFLTVEGSSRNSWACEELRDVVAKILAGSLNSFKKSGNAHSIEVSAKGMRITSSYHEPPFDRVITLEQYVEVVEQWLSILEGKTA